MQVLHGAKTCPFMTYMDVLMQRRQDALELSLNICAPCHTQCIHCVYGASFPWHRAIPFIPEHMRTGILGNCVLRYSNVIHPCINASLRYIPTWMWVMQVLHGAKTCPPMTYMDVLMQRRQDALELPLNICAPCHPWHRAIPFIPEHKKRVKTFGPYPSITLGVFLTTCHPDKCILQSSLLLPVVTTLLRFLNWSSLTDDIKIVVIALRTKSFHANLYK